jgi:nitrite reductase/ring-hydroxylating ferredoxin subunit
MSIFRIIVLVKREVPPSIECAVLDLTMRLIDGFRIANCYHKYSLPCRYIIIIPHKNISPCLLPNNYAAKIETIGTIYCYYQYSYWEKKMENESSWVYVIEENELQENSANMVFPKGLPVLLIKKTGEIYAILNKCSHMTCALAGCTLKDFIIKYPCHAWKYDVRTGEVLSGPDPHDYGEEPIPEGLMKYFQYVGMMLSKIKTYDLETYPVKIEGNSIMVDVD